MCSYCWRKPAEGPDRPAGISNQSEVKDMFGWMIIFALIGSALRLTGLPVEHEVSLKAALILFSALFTVFLAAHIIRTTAR
jgi:hypothetical protein